MKAIEIDGLVKSFKAKEVLHGISLDVDKGDIFGFLGPNGSGKTTTMRVALGMLGKDSGTALVLGEDLSTSLDARRRIGVLFERHGLYERLTVRENLDHYARLFDVPHRSDAVSQTLRDVHMEDRCDDLVSGLSTGLKRRAGLARSLINSPEVLFLDEPTSSLDPQAQRDFRELITELRQHRTITVFMNTHNLDEAQRLCSKVAVLDRGTVRLCGSMDGLRSAEMRTEVVVSSEDEAQRLDGYLRGSGISSDIVRSGKTVMFFSAPELGAKELIGQGFDIREFHVRRRTLDEAYFDTIEREAAA